MQAVYDKCVKLVIKDDTTMEKGKDGGNRKIHPFFAKTVLEEKVAEETETDREEASSQRHSSVNDREEASTSSGVNEGAGRRDTKPCPPGRL